MGHLIVPQTRAKLKVNWDKFNKFGDGKGYVAANYLRLQARNTKGKWDGRLLFKSLFLEPDIRVRSCCSRDWQVSHIQKHFRVSRYAVVTLNAETRTMLMFFEQFWWHCSRHCFSNVLYVRSCCSCDYQVSHIRYYFGGFLFCLCFLCHWMLKQGSCPRNIHITNFHPRFSKRNIWSESMIQRCMGLKFIIQKR